MRTSAPCGRIYLWPDPTRPTYNIENPWIHRLLSTVSMLFHHFASFSPRWIFVLCDPIVHLFNQRFHPMKRLLIPRFLHLEVIIPNQFCVSFTLCTLGLFGYRYLGSLCSRAFIVSGFKFFDVETWPKSVWYDVMTGLLRIVKTG